jgi:hypothetical protein
MADGGRLGRKKKYKPAPTKATEAQPDRMSFRCSISLTLAGYSNPAEATRAVARGVRYGAAREMEPRPRNTTAP